MSLADLISLAGIQGARGAPMSLAPAWHIPPKAQTNVTAIAPPLPKVPGPNDYLNSMVALNSSMSENSLRAQQVKQLEQQTALTRAQVDLYRQAGEPAPPRYLNNGPSAEMPASAVTSSDTQQQSGTSQAGGALSDPRGLAPYIAETAAQYGIDPATALRVASSEGLNNPIGDGGLSGGAFQLYTGDPHALGSVFKERTGLDPLDAENEKATIDFALNHASQNGWGAWNGAKKVGITGMMGIGQSQQQVPAAQGPIAGQNAPNLSGGAPLDTSLAGAGAPMRPQFGGAPPVGVGGGMATSLQPVPQPSAPPATLGGAGPAPISQIDPARVRDLLAARTAAGGSPIPPGYRPSSPGGVVGGQQLSAADAARMNAGVPTGTQLPAMPSDYVFGKGLGAPPGAGAVGQTANSPTDQAIRLAYAAARQAAPIGAAPRQQPPMRLAQNGPMLPPGLSPGAGMPQPQPPPPQPPQGMAGLPGSPAPLMVGAPQQQPSPQMGAPPSQGMAGMPGSLAPQMGRQPQQNPAYESWLRQQDQINAALGRRNPISVEEGLKMLPGYSMSPQYLGQAEAAKTWGGAPAKVWEQNQAPYTLRPGGIRAGPNGPQYGAPTVQEFQNSDGSKYKVLLDPITGKMTPITDQGTQQPAMSAIGPGQTSSLTGRATAEQTQRQVVIHEANDALDSRATLMQMANETPDFYKGAGANKLQDLARYYRIVDPSWNGQVASYEDFVKNLGMVTRQAVRQTSARAAVQEFTMIQNALPNPEMSPVGLRRVQNEMIGLTDYRIAKAQAQQQWENQHGGPGNVTGFETTFQRQASPSAFIVARMDSADRQEMFAKLRVVSHRVV